MYYIIKYLLTPLFLLIGRPEIEGKENIPKEGSYIFACNHLRMLDPAYIIYLSKRKVRFLAKDKYYNLPGFHLLFKIFGCIKVYSNKKNPNALKNAINYLNKGGIVGIYPEGTRNREKKVNLLEFKYGCVKMAKETNSLIVPVCIKGEYKLFHKTRIVIGKPIKVKDDLVSANKKLYNRMKYMIEK